MTIPHGGGRRFGVDSLEFQILSQWVASGAPSPAEQDPSVVALEVYPPAATLAPGARQQLVVRARYSDGEVSDVTPLGPLQLDRRRGRRSQRHGVWSRWSGAGRWLSLLCTPIGFLYARLTVPHDNEISESDFDRLPRNNFIDELVVEKLRKLKIAPSRTTNESEFIRRAYLDAAGVLPSAEEVEEFLGDTPGNSDDKRVRLIDHLLEREEYADYWGLQVVRPAAAFDQ